MNFVQLTPQDSELDEVVRLLRNADPGGRRIAQVLRSTFDQLYDGQRTGRYRWDQLFKTEKTHFGTLFEINLRRALADVIQDGDILDYRIAGSEVDCKYSFKVGGWMLPPESFDQLLLVCSASDETAEWGIGVVRARHEFLRPGANRDLKTGLNETGRDHIHWLHSKAPLPPNVLLQLDSQTVVDIFIGRSGQSRINALFRLVQGRRIGRNTVATVAQQDDYMKRVRYNGGARSILRAEGILILGGDYLSHQAVARQLGIEVPQAGEFVSVRVTRAKDACSQRAFISGEYWRESNVNDLAEEAPLLSHLPIENLRIDSR